MEPERQYWAFLSYSHVDRKWARWLHTALESYLVPRRLVGRETAFGPAPRQFRPIFKDREELRADVALRPRLQEALANSRFLIVICSPAAASSPWVDQEIEQFKTRHGDSTVLAVMVAGSTSTQSVFPPALRNRAPGGLAERGDDQIDLIAVDLRPQGDGRRLALLKLLARMLDVNLDDLARRDDQRRYRQMMAVSAVMATIALAMAGLAGVALLARDEARARRTDAEGLVEFMLTDLTKQLEPEGRLDVLDALGAKAMAYYDTQTRWGIGADALARRARVLELLGEDADKAGHPQQALALFKQATATTSELLAQRPNDPARIFDHAQNLYWLGYLADERGQTRVAQANYEGYARLADQLVKVAPNSVKYMAEVGDAATTLGAFWLKQGRATEAATLIRKGVGIAQTVAAKSPGDRNRLADLATCWAWLADAERRQGDLAAAMSDRLAERRVYQGLLVQFPTDAEAMRALLVNTLALGTIESSAGDDRKAVTTFTDATHEADALLKIHPDHTDYRSRAALAWLSLCRSSLKTGLTKQAAYSADRAYDLASDLTRRDSTVSEWSGNLLGDARIAKARVAAVRASSPSELRAALAPMAIESKRLAVLADLEASNVKLARVAAEAALLAGDYASLSGSKTTAMSYWRQAEIRIASSGGQEARLTTDRDMLVLIASRQRLEGHSVSNVVFRNRPGVALDIRMRRSYDW